MRNLKIRNYQLGSRGVKIVLLSDLHNRPYEAIIAQVREIGPDLIAVSGDMTYDFDHHDRVAGFLKACGEIAPAYVSLGNHDRVDVLSGMDMGKAVLLDNRYTDIIVKTGATLRIGGLSSPAARYSGRLQSVQYELKLKWLEEFCDTASCKLLLCHQPEFYPVYLKKYPIDLILSGHAHGGQWRVPFTNQGVFAPGQGIFPKLTGGVIDDRLVISRGLSNTVRIPRFFNPREIVVVEM